MYEKLLAPINAFLQNPTPVSWVTEAKKPENLPILLRDHLICELKAAQSALFLLKRYALTSAGAEQVALLIKPYEEFAYKRIGNLETLKGKNVFTASIKARSDCSYGQNMIDKMVLLIKEELHTFTKS